MATPSLQSLERGLAILKALNAAPGMGIDSLSILLSLSRGTTYRLLETLRRGGYVVPITKETLDGAPRYEEDRRPRYDDEYGRTVYDYYGVGW